MARWSGASRKSMRLWRRQLAGWKAGTVKMAAPKEKTLGTAPSAQPFGRGGGDG